MRIPVIGRSTSSCSTQAAPSWETHDITTTDLYAMGFDPVLSKRDLGSQSHLEDSFLNRWAAAYNGGDLLPEIRAEQQKLLDADLIVLQFPLWWYSLPTTEGMDRSSVYVGFWIRPPARA